MRSFGVNISMKFALIFSAVATAAPVFAQGAAPATAAPTQAKPADPMSEIVCQKQEVPGSRVATKRICMTRLQWQEQKTLNRQDVERAQIGPDRQKPGG
jgi:invasion protein IalB